MTTKQYEGYSSVDMISDEAWLRVFQVTVGDNACALVLFQHHVESVSDIFDHKTEGNIGLLCAGNFKDAINLIERKHADGSVNPIAIRRVRRLLSHGSLTIEIENTILERGLERAVCYSDNNRYLGKLAEAAGCRLEQRNGHNVYVLEVQD